MAYGLVYYKDMEATTNNNPEATEDSDEDAAYEWPGEDEDVYAECGEAEMEALTARIREGWWE
jgi:hypothetical protein